MKTNRPKKHKQNKQLGFTLIELLVVIAIVGLLAAVIIANIVSARRQARDTIVKSHVRTLEQAFSQYAGDNGDYPPTQRNLTPGSGAIQESCTNNSTCNAAPSFSALVTGGYLTKLPVPPAGAKPGTIFGPGLTYMHRIASDEDDAGLRVTINCNYIASTCGVKPPATLFGCYGVNGNLPEDATAKAVLFFALENGTSADYTVIRVGTGGSTVPVGGNAICLY